MIFTAGLPGSGKTFALKQRYGLENLVMLDLDVIMKEHPDFDPAEPARIYSERSAYAWADDRLQEEFEGILKRDPQPPLVAFDGTGTKVKRRIERMHQAREAGYWIRLLHIRVSLATALERNSRRHRRVPNHVLEQYQDELEAAIDAEKPHADEFIIHDNDEDDGWTGRQRWESWYDIYNERFRVDRDINVEDEFHDGSGWTLTPPLHDRPRLERSGGLNATRMTQVQYKPVLLDLDEEKGEESVNNGNTAMKVGRGSQVPED